MDSITSRPGRFAIAAALVLSVAVTACGDDDSSAGTVPVAEWVAQFDKRCVEVGAELSDRTLTDAQFAEISQRAIAEMRAFGVPDEMADEAQSMLDAIEATTADTTLDDETINDLDRQFLVAATAMGVSDACIGGAER